MNNRIILAALVTAMLAIACLAGRSVIASDHDDGETDIKGRNQNLTDLYVFREGDQTGVLADNANLIFIMNTNPRSLARQQYFFSTRSQYQFKVTRQPAVGSVATGAVDVLLQFTFGGPDAGGRQPITVSATRDGATVSGSAGATTPLSFPAGAPTITPITLFGSTLSVFAGLREDPFFFDVESYFRVRAGALGIGPAVGFRAPGAAIDFAKGYNVNAIVVRVPIAFLAGATGATVFDVWEVINAPQ